MCLYYTPLVSYTDTIYMLFRVPIVFMICIICFVLIGCCVDILSILFMSNEQILCSSLHFFHGGNKRVYLISLTLSIACYLISNLAGSHVT